jgi:hypothetical protein
MGVKRVIKPVGITATSEVSADIQIRISTRLMLHWSQIAVAQERRALEARRTLEEAQRAGEGLALDLELHPAMIAVAGAAHALEALYGEIAELVQPPNVETWERTRRHGRWAEVQGAFALGFEIEPSRWRSELAQLFRLRNAIVHPRTVFRASEAHPLGVNTAPEYVAYSAEAATKAVDLLLDVLTTCVDAPREPLRGWVEDARASVRALVEARASY